MRRILFPLLVIGLAAGLFSLGSGAFFSDTATDTGNVIAAGTLDLLINLETDDIVTNQCSIAVYQPQGGISNDVDFDGPLENCTVTVKNNGTLAGDLFLKIVIVDEACNSAGANDGSEFCDVTANLGTQLTVVGCTDTTGTGSEVANPCTGTTTLLSLAFSCVKVSDLGAKGSGSDTYILVFDLSDGSVTNLSQGDKVTVNMTFELVQDSVASPLRPDGTCA